MTHCFSAYRVADGAFTGMKVFVPDPDQLWAPEPGTAWWPGDFDHEAWRVEAGEVVPRAPTGPDLEALKTQAWARIKSARVVAEAAPVEAGGRVFDADPQSQLRISGAVQMAQLAMAAGYGEVWSIEWTLADNTSVSLTAREMTDLGLAVATQISASHARSRILRDRINAATTPDELAAITWD